MKPTRAAPRNAREVIATTDEDHNFRHEPIDYHSTGGIQRALERNWVAIQRLAEYVDGVRPGQPGVDGGPLEPTGQRTEEDERVAMQRDQAQAEWAAGTPPGPNGPDDLGTPGVEKQTPVNVNPTPPGA